MMDMKKVYAELVEPCKMVKWQCPACKTYNDDEVYDDCEYTAILECDYCRDSIIVVIGEEK